ncbi:MAG: UPF0149 family protein [Gammaproteobacteria bacterium]|nr:UPF0149 family protein [Gammaproteobacteria bacterium]
MTSANLPDFDKVAAALRQLGATEGATAAHGTLCGLLCVLGGRASPVWVANVVGIDPADRGADAPQVEVLSALVSATAGALADGEMSFLPLLPPDDQPLPQRADALADWCAGFMHGLGEGAGSSGDGQALDGDVSREIMNDFAEIARVSLGDDETELEAEAAYAELVEFVRVGVQLLFEELHDVRRAATAGRVH